jgi:hypothetical protein
MGVLLLPDSRLGRLAKISHQPPTLPTAVVRLSRSRSWNRSYFAPESRSVCRGIEPTLAMLLSKMWGLVTVVRPLWREDGSVICSGITEWSESIRTRNHTLLSHLRLPQPWGPGSCIYTPRKRVAQLYPWALGSLYVASCDSQVKI